MQKTTAEMETLLETAKDLGGVAFSNGLKSAPMYDRSMDSLYKGCSTKQHISLSKAWASAWFDKYNAIQGIAIIA